MSALNIDIAHPEWLNEEKIAKAYQLYRQGRLPKPIAGFMLATPLVHDLRAIFGSDRATAKYIAKGAFDHWWNPRWQRFVGVWYRIPWIVARIWTSAWIRWQKFQGNPYYGMWGRHDSPEPTRCEECVWKGPRRWALHGYGDDGSGEDVEPRDGCPRCGAEI